MKRTFLTLALVMSFATVAHANDISAMQGAQTPMPDLGRLHRIYNQLGAYEPSETAFRVKEPSEELLHRVYEYAVSAGYVDPKSHEFVGKRPRLEKFMPFNIHEATDFVYENGALVGYLDEKSNRFDVNGKYVVPSQNSVAKTAGTDACGSPPCTGDILSFYENKDFTGVRSGYWTTTNSGTFDLSGLLKRSLIVAPGISVKLYWADVLNGPITGSTTFPYAATPRYYADFPKYFKRLELIRSEYSGNKRSRRCGILWTDADYKGNSLPFYDEQHFDLNRIPFNAGVWDNKVTSISITQDSACEKIGVTDRAGGVADFGSRRLIAGENIYFGALLVVGIANLASQIHAVNATENATLIKNDTISHVDTLGTPTTCAVNATDPEDEKISEPILGSLTQLMLKRGRWPIASFCNTAAEICNPTTPYLPSLAMMSAAGTFKACAGRANIGLDSMVTLLTAGGQAWAGDLEKGYDTLKVANAQEKLVHAVSCVAASCATNAIAVGACNTFVRDWCQRQVDLSRN